jgi:hypothetical protein
MPLDVGRVTHLTDQMHRSEDDAGDPIDAGLLLAADGARGHTWTDPATLVAGGLPWYDVKVDGTAVGDGSTDDTAAIQAAITAATASATQSATLYFPPGVYLIGGALQDTGAFNGQILLPNVPIDATHAEVVIRFVGASRPPFAVVPTQPIPGVSDGFSVLKSTLTGASGTASVISGGNTTYNNISVVVENLVCIAPANPTMTFWNLLNSQGATVQDVMIWTTDWLGGTLPTHSNSFGMKLPGDTQGNYTRVQGLSVRNFYTGVRGGDLVVASGLQVSVCIVGWDNPAGSWPSLIEDIFLNGCLYGVRGTGGSSTLDVLRYSHEHYPADPTYATLYDLDDPSNYIHGALRWWNVEWSVGPDHIFTVNGGTNTSNAEVGPLTAAPSFATPAIVLGTAAAAGAASTVIRSDSTIVAFDATVPVTQAFGDTAATGSVAKAARRDHKHGMPATPTAGIGEILISDTPAGSPLVFADLIQNEAQDDLVYADP